MSLPAQSYSSLKLYDQCARKYFHLRVAKDVKEPASEAMMYGTKMHQAAEDYMRDGTPLPPYLEYAKAALDKLREFPGERLCEFKLGLTERLEPCEFDAPDVWFRGIIDLVILNHDTGEARIVDYKTGKSTKYADTGQLELMALGIFRHFPKITSVKAGLLFVVCNAFIKVKYDAAMQPALWNKWLQQYVRIESSYESNVWNPNPSGLCRKHCAVASCPHNGANR